MTKKYNWQKEIEELHVFFENWLSGRLEPTQNNYRRFNDVADNKFNLISPNGVLQAGNDLLEDLYQAHGKRKDIKIWTKDKKLLFENSEILVVSYQEWQQEAAGDKGRISTAVLIFDETKINGLRWLHVHETWLPVKA